MKKSKSCLLSFLLIGILLFLSGCGTKNTVIHIATKPITEQLILGEMLTLLIESETDLKVNLTQGVGGGTANIHPAMESGKFDLYPEYTGTAWLYVLKKNLISDYDALYQELCKEYEETYKLQWLGLYGFNNTYGLAIRKDLADQYGIKTYSDLAAYSSQLTFGSEYDFYEREDGYQALSDTYGFAFRKALDIDIGLKYQAIEKQEVDVINIFTTDGQLSSSNVTLLEDDLGFYPTYYCGTVIRMDFLQEHPELQPVLEKLNNAITSEEMSELNHKVETLKEKERDVAEEFLKKKGLL